MIRGKREAGQPQSAPWYYTPGWGVTNNQISLGGSLQNLEGKLWTRVADNSRTIITAKAEGEKHINASVANLTPTVSITVVSNATHVGGTNWAAVKATNEYVYIEATLSNGDTNAVTNVVWSANVETVPGQPAQRRVSKAESKEIPVIARLGDRTSGVDVWILWAGVTVKHSGPMTPVLANGLLGNTANFPSYIPGTTLGPVNLLNGTNGNLGWKVEIQGKLSPRNVGRVVTMGWDFSQTMSHHVWVGTTNSFTAVTNAPDEEFSSHGAGWKDLLPDGVDRVFILDAPGYLENPPTPFFKRESNFSVWLKWGTNRCSDNALWWVSQKVETANSTPNVILNAGGNGEIESSNEY